MWTLIRNKFKRRPFPANLEALRHCRISYGQYGEDLFLTLLFGYEKTEGVYVDVGCFQPIFYSNTYIFYERGWRGVAIDPNPSLKSQWAHRRPGDTFVNCAISKNCEAVTYLQHFRHPARNRVVHESETHDPAQYKASICDAAPLSEILAQHLSAPRIDLLNIDCEGRDLQVLETHDFEKHRPVIIAIEDRDISLETPVSLFLLARNYECLAYIGLTKIFRAKDYGLLT